MITRWCHDKHLMHLLWYLFFIEAHGLYCIHTEHIAEVNNGAADNLLRNNLPVFSLKFRPTSPRQKFHPTTRLPESSTGAQPGLDLTNLDKEIQFYSRQGLAILTQKTYRAASNRFHAFCVKYSVYNPFLLSERTMWYFATYLAQEGLAAHSIKIYLAASRNIQISLGFPDPCPSQPYAKSNKAYRGCRAQRASCQSA